MHKYMGVILEGLYLIVYQFMLFSQFLPSQSIYHMFYYSSVVSDNLSSCRTMFLQDIYIQYCCQQCCNNYLPKLFSNIKDCDKNCYFFLQDHKIIPDLSNFKFFFLELKHKLGLLFYIWDEKHKAKSKQLLSLIYHYLAVSTGFLIHIYFF